MKKLIIISISILLNLGNFSALSLLGEETKGCLTCALEAQGTLLSFFSMSTLPIEIVNKLFNEEQTAQKPSNSKEKKEKSPLSTNQPTITVKTSEIIKKQLNAEHCGLFASISTNMPKYAAFICQCRSFFKPDILLNLSVHSYLIALYLNNLPGLISVNIQAIFKPGSFKDAGFFIC